MKKFKCKVTKETTMDIEIDDSIWTDEAIETWSKVFNEADNLSEVVEQLAVLKSEYEDGEFIEGFNIPLINGKTPYVFIKDSDVSNEINIIDEHCETTVDIEGIS